MRDAFQRRQSGIKRIFVLRRQPLARVTHEQPQPLAQPRTAARVHCERLQGREPGRATVLQGEIGSSRGADIDLSPPVLVDQELACSQLLRLAQQEVEQHRLARPRRANDQRVPDIGHMKVEIVGRAALRLEHTDGRSPVVAAAFAHREGVIRAHRRIVARGDQRRARPHCEVTRQLRPIGSFKREILARRDHSAFTQHGASDTHVLPERLDRLTEHRQLQRVFAEHKFIRLEIIHCLLQIARLANGHVICGGQLSGLAAGCFGRIGLGNEGKALPQHEFKIDSKQPVEHSRRSSGCVLANPEHPREAGSASLTDLNRFVREDHPVRVERVTKMPAHQRHTPVGAQHDRAQKLQNLGEDQPVLLIERQQARAGSAEQLRRIAQRCLEVGQALRFERSSPIVLFEEARKDLVADRIAAAHLLAVNDCEIEIIHVHARIHHRSAIVFVQLGREPARKLTVGIV